jgi:adenosyl cobinamide kinase/adenosyl cobinamide phosphate guanylyltransferase
VIVLVLGGARSGKSEVAEAWASRSAGAGGQVSYLATADRSGADPEMAARIEEHERRRPAHWTTRELPFGGDLGEALSAEDSVALVDSLGTWVAGHEGFSVDIDRLVAALVGRGSDTILVSDEVGLGVHPSSEAGRHYRDALGLLNKAVAAVADEVLLVVAGRTLRLESLAMGVE